MQRRGKRKEAAEGTRGPEGLRQQCSLHGKGAQLQGPAGSAAAAATSYSSGVSLAKVQEPTGPQGTVPTGVAVLLDWWGL